MYEVDDGYLINFGGSNAPYLLCAWPGRVGLACRVNNTIPICHIIYISRNVIKYLYNKKI